MQPIDFKALFETYKNAAFDKDEAALLQLYADDVIAFDMWGAWSIEGLDAMRTMVKGWFASLGDDRDAIAFEPVRMVAGSELALAETFVSYTAVNAAGTPLRSMQNRLTWVAAARNGAWKIIHQHTSSPIDPATASVVFNRQPTAATAFS
jgi:uncharacterized protein (TIGR02246 family)